MALKKKKPEKPKKKNMDAILMVGVLLILMVSYYTIGKSRQLHPEEEKTAPTQASTTQPGAMAVRKPAVAGSFYPADPTELEGVIDEYLDRADDVRLPNVMGLVVPHAGYAYSGPTAAWGFKQLIGREINTVIVLAPSHTLAFKGAALLNATHFETPLGLVKVSPKAKELAREDGFPYIPQAHAKEHALEVELPFLQETLGDFELVPVVLGAADPEAVSKSILKVLDDKTLIVASSDLSHYHPYDEAVRLDSVCTSAVPSLDLGGVGSCEACGIIPIHVLMRVARERGWVGKLLDYRNSGDTGGDKSSVVGYSSIAFFDGLNASEEEFLLNLSRETLNAHFNGGGSPRVDESALTPKLKKVSGCFVTLNKHGSLRGCIGHIIAQKPLYECVIENSLSAALRDGRFRPVEKEELPEIRIDVSVLTAPGKLSFSSSDDLLGKLVPGRDGVVLMFGGRQSTYLPQVWDQIPVKTEFLSQLCLKQGSPRDCWARAGAQVNVYRAQVFEEKQ